MVTIQLALDQFKHQYHSIDHRLQRWTQVLLIFFLLTLTLTTDSVQQHLRYNLTNLLGADLVINQYQPLSVQQLAYLSQHSESISQQQLHNLTLTHNNQWQAIQMKVVDESYPLDGNVMVSQQLGYQASARTSGPEAGNVWVDSRLSRALSLNIGDSLAIGNTSFIVNGVIEHEPDRLTEGHSVAMRLMMNQADFLATGIVQNSVKYRYLINADAGTIPQMITWAEENLSTANVLHRAGGHPLALFWQRTENFLGLTSVLLFLMAAIAIDQTTGRQLVSQNRFMALCLSMGLGRLNSLSVVIYQWLLIFLSALLPALILALCAQYLIIAELRHQFPTLELVIQTTSILKVCLLLLCLTGIFQFPSWIALLKSSVSDLIRNSSKTSSIWLRLLWSLTSVALLTLYYSDNPLLTAMTLGSMAATLILMIFLTWITLTLGEKITAPMAGKLPFTLYIMRQRLLTKATQILGVGLCATLLLFSLVMLKDIGETIASYTRDYDGNLLISQADDKATETIEEWAKESNVIFKQFRPYFESQLVKINDRALSEHTDTPSATMARMSEPVRLHFTETLPLNNRVTSGSFWDENEINKQMISVEDEVMSDLEIELGDKLSFVINGNTYDFIITSSHVYRSGHGSITFWFQVPYINKTQINAAPFMMGSVEVPEHIWPSLATLWQELPTVRMVSLKEMTERFDNTLLMVQKLISGYALMIILLAALVIIASVKGYEINDRRRNGLLLSFGLQKTDCIRIAIYEWFITALIAALGAIVGCWLIAELIYEEQFSMTYSPDYLMLFFTLCATLTYVIVIGIFSSRRSLSMSVQQLLAQE